MKRIVSEWLLLYCKQSRHLCLQLSKVFPDIRHLIFESNSTVTLLFGALRPRLPAPASFRFIHYCRYTLLLQCAYPLSCFLSIDLHRGYVFTILGDLRLQQLDIFNCALPLLQGVQLRLQLLELSEEGLSGVDGLLEGGLVLRGR